MAQQLKNLPAIQDTWVQSLGWEDPLEEEMATHSSILAWKIPWAGESVGLQSVQFSSVAQSCQTLCDPMDCSSPGTVTPLSMEFSRQEYWSGLPCPSPGDLPDLGIEPGSPAWQADSLLSEPLGKPAYMFNSVQSLSRVQLFATP